MSTDLKVRSITIAGNPAVTGDLIFSGPTVSGNTITFSGGGGDMLASNNLSELTNDATARTNLGLGQLATQDGTFSGSSSGVNTGDQTSIVGITGTKAQFDTAVTDGNILYVGDVTTNATHTGEVTGSSALTIDPTAISNKVEVTAAVGDTVLIGDASDSNNLKKATIQTIIDLAGSSGVSESLAIAYAVAL